MIKKILLYTAAGVVALLLPVILGLVGIVGGFILQFSILKVGVGLRASLKETK